MGNVFKRARFRAWCRQNQSNKDVKKLLANDKLFEKVYAEVEDAHEQAMEGHGGILQDLIEWIKSDPQGFLQFIASLVALFSM